MNAFDAAYSFERSAKAGDFMRWAQCLMMARGSRMEAVNLFENRYPRSKNLGLIHKAAVSPGTTTDGDWAAPLAELQPLASEFVDLLRPQTVLGKMQGLRRVPFNIKFPVETAGVAVAWVGQARPVAVSEMAFTSDTFTHSKIAGIVAVSKELANSSDPAAEKLIQSDMVKAVAQFSDQQFLDPTVAAVTDVSPASITNGATEIALAPTDDISDGLRRLLSSITSGAPVLIMRKSTALNLAFINAFDFAYQNVGANGGTLWGVPIIVSNSVPHGVSSPVTDIVVAVDANEILLAEGPVELDASEQAAVQFNNAPDSPPTASSVMMSLWQMNLVGLLVKRYVRWQRRRDDAVAILTGIES